MYMNVNIVKKRNENNYRKGNGQRKKKGFSLGS